MKYIILVIFCLEILLLGVLAFTIPTQPPASTPTPPYAKPTPTPTPPS